VWLVLKRNPVVVAFLLAPGLLVTAAFMLYPLANGILLSFTNSSPLRAAPRVVGLRNYERLLGDAGFWEVIFNSFLLVGAAVAMSMVVGFGLALLLNQKLRGTYFFRVGIFQIWVIPWISVAILWGWIFNSDYGVVNFLLMDLGLLENKVNWLASEVLARLVIILGFAWRMIPFMMVISLAALQSISKDILDAAAIDGARPWHRLRDITLPLLKNMMFVVGLLQAVKLFQEITLPWVLTQGGPINATTTLSLYTYKLAFQKWEFGMASAVGTLWLVVLFVFALVYLKFFVAARDD